MIKCCEEWAENYPKVNAPFAILSARNPLTYKGYDGKKFKYCPWCAKPLTDISSSPQD